MKVKELIRVLESCDENAEVSFDVTDCIEKERAEIVEFNAYHKATSVDFVIVLE